MEKKPKTIVTYSKNNNLVGSIAGFAHRFCGPEYKSLLEVGFILFSIYSFNKISAY